MRRSLLVLALGILGAVAVVVGYFAAHIGPAATKNFVTMLALRTESAMWPVTSRISAWCGPGPSDAEREVWNALIREYARGPHGTFVPLGVNPIAEWPGREREPPADVTTRIVDGRGPNEPGNPEALSAVQDFIWKAPREGRVGKLKLSPGAKFIPRSEFDRFNDPRFAWVDFSGANHVDAYLSMSRVGFNLFGTCAVVYVELSCGGLCGHGTYWVLRRTNGEWRVVGDHLRWIA